MLDVQQWEEWMLQNYPIRFAKYDNRMGRFVECELEDYEAQGKEMDSVLELMSKRWRFRLYRSDKRMGSLYRLA